MVKQRSNVIVLPESRRFNVYISAEKPELRYVNNQANASRMMYLFDMLHFNRLRRVWPAYFVDKFIGAEGNYFYVEGIPLWLALSLAKRWDQYRIFIDGLGALELDTMTLEPQIKKWYGNVERMGDIHFCVGHHRHVSYRIDWNREIPVVVKKA